MKKIITIIILLSICPLISKSQTPRCDTLPMSIINSNILFMPSDWTSFGDYMFTFYISNDHLSQGFAYPQAKIDPQSPLPSGMSISSINSTWAVFASAWNPGDVTEVKIYYDMVGQIPVDYTVSFDIWINNLQPLLSDSCVFDSTFVLNLNPSSTGIKNPELQSQVQVFPNPASHNVNLIGAGMKHIQSINLLNELGEIIRTENIQSGISNYSMNVETLRNGIYFLSMIADDSKILKKLVILNGTK